MDLNSKFTRRGFLQLSAVTLAVAAVPWTVPAQAKTILEQSNRSLMFVNLHTNEHFASTYWRGGHYDKDALRGFNYLLRDFHCGEVTKMDLHLFDLLHKLQARLGCHAPIEIISGYRSPATNRQLAATHKGVAKKSFHMQGKAIDLRISGVRTEHIHKAALRLKAGGVGHYPASDFVHVDTGPVRTW